MKHAYTGFKRAQQETATPAALFVLLILALILLYVLFIPPEERNELLNISDSSESNGNGGSADIEDADFVVLEEQPGTLVFKDQTSFKHTFSDIYLIKRSEGALVDEWNSAYVSHSFFRDKEAYFEVEIPNWRDLVEPYLTFGVVKSFGVVQIYFNDALIYEGELELGTINPIKIKKSYLSEHNVITFKAVSPGLAFWRTNYFQLKDIKLFATIVEKNLNSRTTFLVYPEELSEPEKLSLRFYPDCVQTDIGYLDASINGVNVYHGVPVCGNVNYVEYSPTVLKKGSNTLEFNSQGSALLREVVVEVQSKKQVYPTYYFNLDEDDYDAIESGAKKAMLYIEFVDSDNKLELNINGNLLYLETDDYILRDISELVHKTGNYITFVPKKNIKINLVEIYLKQD